MGTGALSFWGALVLLVSTALPAGAVQLVTPDEVARDQAAPRAKSPMGKTRALGVPAEGPGIIVEKPEINSAVQAPVAIRVRFVPLEGGGIDLPSFRVLYGWLGLDITDRLLAEATLTPAGLRLDRADIPPGNHRIRMRLKDTAGRSTEKDIEFTIR